MPPLPATDSALPRVEPVSSPFGPTSRDPRAIGILAKTIYRELRQSGLAEQDVMALAGELLSLVTVEVLDRRRSTGETTLDRDEPR